MNILLANPRGFCAGVNRAISIVLNVLNKYNSPIYVMNEIVHNNYVVNFLSQKGVIFVKEIQEVPNKSILIFSAHGVSKSLYKEALNKNLTIFDATCPLVKKVHAEINKFSRRGSEVIYIGHSGHPEVEGSIGQYDNPKGKIHLIESLKDIKYLNINNRNNLFYATQTTLSIFNTSKIINELKKIFPLIKGPRKSDICYATYNRQRSIYKLSMDTDLILIVGSNHSSNSRRLLELARIMNKESYLVEKNQDIEIKWFFGKKNIGITSAASSPDILIRNLIRHLRFFLKIENVIEKDYLGFKENVLFSLPKGLR